MATPDMQQWEEDMRAYGVAMGEDAESFRQVTQKVMRYRQRSILKEIAWMDQQGNKPRAAWVVTVEEDPEG